MEINLDQKEKISLEERSCQNNLEKGGFFKKIVDWYFRPKFFEKGGKLYELMGIKLFRKYVPNGGSWFSRKIGNSFLHSKTKKCLKTFEERTRVLEGMHIAGFPLFAYLFTYGPLLNGDYKRIICSTFVNTLINLYPVMCQRYNRNKVLPLIERLEQREKGSFYKVQ